MSFWFQAGRALKSKGILFSIIRDLLARQKLTKESKKCHLLGKLQERRGNYLKKKS